LSTAASNAGSAPPGDRLDSWKEISAYLRRSERTVRRWEKLEGLPVHRLQHDKRGSIYAYTAELTAWIESKRHLVEREPEPDVAPLPTGVRWKGRRVSALTVLVLALGLLGYWLVRARVAAGRLPDPEAVRLTKMADFGANPGRIQVQTSIKYLRDAVRIDPDYAVAWGQLATAHLSSTWYGNVSAAETMRAAKSEAEEALRLNPRLAAGWRVLGWVSHYNDWDHVTAERQFRKAIELEPTERGAIGSFSEFLLDERRYSEAMTYSRRAQEAAPTWLEAVTVYGNIYYMSGKFDLAIAEYQRALDIQPSYGLANHFLGRAYLANGEATKAIGQLRKSDELLGHVPYSVGDLGYALGVTGHRSEAEQLLLDLNRKVQSGYYPAFPLGEIELGLGHIEASLDWLDRAAAERHMGYYLPSVDPVYDSIRSHPRFKRLMERMNLGYLNPT
jgi:tetratricopeptide (TPR) repeat protein